MGLLEHTKQRRRSTTLAKKKRRYLKDYVNWLWPYRWALVVLFALSFGGAVLDMVWPLAHQDGDGSASAKARLGDKITSPQ